MEAIFSDLRFAVRTLIRNPGFSLAALISLALGIGANTAIFTVANALLLRPTQVADEQRLVAIHPKLKNSQFLRSSYPELQDIRSSCPTFSFVYARTHWPISMQAEVGKPEVRLAYLVSEDYFRALGIVPSQGRFFLSEETKPGAAGDVVVLSHGYWRASLPSGSNAVGMKIRINSQPYTVIGIAPPGFRGELSGFAADAWIPLPAAPRVILSQVNVTDRYHRMLDLAGRLKDGITPTQAKAALGGVAERLRREYPKTNREVQFEVIDGGLERFPIVELGRGVRAFLIALSVVVGLVLLIACSNVTNLMLARAAARQGEIAIRLALGARRRQLMRQLLAESMLLSIGAAGVGALIGIWALDLFGMVDVPAPMPVDLNLTLDWRVLCFTTGLALLAGVIAGLIPAMRSGSLSPTEYLREHSGGTASSSRSGRTQAALAVAQVALSLVLVVSAGLCLKSLGRALQTDPGFEINRLALTSLNLSYGSYDPVKGRAFQDELLNRVRNLPGVASASLALLAPLSTARNTVEFDVEGYKPAAGERLLMDANFVDADYFKTMGIPLVEGRVIDERDVPGGARIAVVNETMARRFWPGQSAVGRTLRRGDDRITVIGVVRDSRHFTLNEASQPFLYFPLRQEYMGFFSLMVRTRGEPAASRADIAAILAGLDSNLPEARVLTMREHLRLSQFPAILAGMMVGSFGLLALTLAVIGVYGVIAYSVRKRTKELGIRAALGASRGRILSSVLLRGLWIAGIGVGLGLIGSYALTPLLSQLLIDVSPRDPWVLGGVSLALTAAVLLASYIPARAAARADILSTIRFD